MTATNRHILRELAYRLCIGRGQPLSSPLQDWLEAERPIGAPALGSSIDDPETPIKFQIRRKAKWMR